MLIFVSSMLCEECGNVGILKHQKNELCMLKLHHNLKRSRKKEHTNRNWACTMGKRWDFFKRSVRERKTYVRVWKGS